MYYANYRPKDDSSSAYSTLGGRRAMIDAINDCKAFISHAAEKGYGEYEAFVCKGKSNKPNNIVWDSERDQ